MIGDFPLMYLLLFGAVSILAICFFTLREEVKKLKFEVELLRGLVHKMPPVAPPQKKQEAPKPEGKREFAPVQPFKSPLGAEEFQMAAVASKPAQPLTPRVVSLSPQSKMPSKPLEAQGEQRGEMPLEHESQASFSFSAEKLIVWIAGFAAVLGAFYLVRLAIENGLLTPWVRVALTYAFGVGAIAGGFYMAGKPSIANGARIGSALMGAGTAAFYFASFALSRLYDLAPDMVSFALMCGTTVLTIALALGRGGLLMGVLALLGGMATPALVGQPSDSALNISGYLLVISCAFVFIARHKQSALLLWLLMALLGAWVFAYRGFNYHDGDTLWLSLALLIPAILSFYLCRWMPAGARNALQVVSLVICATFTYSNLPFTHFAPLDWGLVGLVLLALTALSFTKDRRFYYPFFMLALTLALIFNEEATQIPWLKATVHVGSMLLATLPFYAALCFKQIRRNALHLAIFTPLLAFFDYLCSGELLSVSACLLWAAAALAMAAASALTPALKSREQNGHRLGGALIISCAIMLTMLSFNVLQLADCDFEHIFFIPFAVAVLSLGLLHRYSPYGLMPLGMALLALPLALFSLIVFTLGACFVLINSPSLAKSLLSEPIVWVGLGCLMGISAPLAVIGRAGWARITARCLLMATCACALIDGYGLLRMHLLDCREYQFNMVENACLTLVLLTGYALADWRHNKLYLIAFWVGVVRLVPFLPVVLAPFIHEEQASCTLGIVLGYLLPAGLLLYGSTRAQGKSQAWQLGLVWGAAILSWLGISCLVTQIMQGTLYWPDVKLDDASVFAYSIAWLVLAAAGLLYSLKHREMIKPTFTLIYLTICKVFLYDVSSLDGVWRVIALFALAGTLLGISHVYARFFKEGKKAEQDTPSEL